eukprot:CAMPEP_0168618878 /NCGR_PEP_ID=MMETSP0449_2-20121227/6305_1 /TAXON_ID=1082188 /ORGANISM="Strombidium rassoulzadegani, Strain ras09" /LENGTH=59 /DNA_ID=CAMNT_0008659779 /DNA_START=38 /DNA_END=217 /DNA_ORIENTATION=+
MQKVLTAALLLASTSAIKLKAKHDEIDELFSYLDLNGDGVLSRDEVHDLVKSGAEERLQ